MKVQKDGDHTMYLKALDEKTNYSERDFLKWRLARKSELERRKPETKRSGRGKQYEYEP